MPVSPVLIPSDSVFLTIDVQERLLKSIENSSEIVDQINLAQHVCNLLQVPVIQFVQNEQGLGPIHPKLTRATIAATLEKKAFSPFIEDDLRRFLEGVDASQWILTGLESHICVLQTARDLLRMGKHVVVLADATSSLSVYDYASALSELRQEGARVCTTQTLIFDWLKRSDHPAFKIVLKWLKQMSQRDKVSSCCKSLLEERDETASSSCGCASTNEDSSSKGCCQL